MGSNVDYFRVRSGYTFCNALAGSNGQFEWSPHTQMASWVVPNYYNTHHFGGSQNAWPKNNYANLGDQRNYLTFWGSGSHTGNGGCCHNTLTDSAAWNRAFSIYVLT